MLRVLAVYAVTILSACVPRPAPSPAAQPRPALRRSVLPERWAPGSHGARIDYDCGWPHGRNVAGGGTLLPAVARCRVDEAGTLTLDDGGRGHCPGFLLTIRGYRGPGVYNSSSLGALSLGAALVRQDACGWRRSCA